MLLQEVLLKLKGWVLFMLRGPEKGASKEEEKGAPERPGAMSQ